MSATFDFQALVARAPDEQPDALLQADLDAMADLDRRYRSRLPLAQRLAAGQDYLKAQRALAARKPVTVEGLLLKLRTAEALVHKAPIFELQAAALSDVIEWLDPPKPRRRRRA
jgi:hypothetical protein